VAIGETPFLEATLSSPSARRTARKVGRIDNILVVPESNPLNWCPVEKQAVYFSGKEMAHEFRAMAASEIDGLPFPIISRRPDYRSSGPKRLLPQLEVKVPTLSTWGTKMAVVVDSDFFGSLGEMRPANDLSNAELVWFIVEFVQQVGHQFTLRPQGVFATRLKDAIEGLIAATPIPKPQFEDAIRSRLKRITSAS
jgi:hypothetical protein